MKKLIRFILNTRVVRMLLTPGYRKPGGVSGKKLCIVLSDENMLGDLVLHNFIVQQLALYGYTVSYAMNEAFHKRFSFFFGQHCLAARLFVYPGDKRRRSRFTASIREEDIDTVILDECPLVGGRPFYSAGVPVIIGPRTVSSVYYSKEYRLDKLNMHYTQIIGALLDLLGHPREEKPHAISPFFPYEPIETDALEEITGDSLAIHLGGGGYWDRRWPQERFIDLCRLFLSKYEGDVLLVGGQEEYDRNERVREILVSEGKTAGRVLNLCGGDLHWLASVLSRSKVFLGNDSAPMNVAVALNKRVVGIFGPSPFQVFNPTRYDPMNITIHSELACVPCNSNHCRLDDEHKLSCLTGLPTVLVWEKLQSIF